jgi:hypothetical protein
MGKKENMRLYDSLSFCLQPFIQSTDPAAMLPKYIFENDKQ